MILIFLLFIEIIIVGLLNLSLKDMLYALIGLIISLKAFYILYGIFFLVILNHLLRNDEMMRHQKNFFLTLFLFLHL